MKLFSSKVNQLGLHFGRSPHAGNFDLDNRQDVPAILRPRINDVTRHARKHILDTIKTMGNYRINHNQDNREEMVSESEYITIYICFWGTESYTFGRSEKEAYKNLTTKCAAYAEPIYELEARYMRGTKWAESGEEVGWRIEPQEIEVRNIFGTTHGSFEKNERVHYYAKCLVCNDTMTGDVEQGELFPRLVVCHHRKPEQKMSYYLVHIKDE